MERDVTRHDETATRQQDRDEAVPLPEFKRLQQAAELPVRRHRRREYPLSDED
ncbi:hypothetical protein ACQP00_01805 [Dactylosporangium sp. CS-047395]|uniref:hypothetical protein n=1 Tax=Dactylosporangium sp. CS-047395 TaxID=3239936 RepID=UPI003D8DBF7E